MLIAHYFGQRYSMLDNKWLKMCNYKSSGGLPETFFDPLFETYFQPPFWNLFWPNCKMSAWRSSILGEMTILLKFKYYKTEMHNVQLNNIHVACVWGQRITCFSQQYFINRNAAWRSSILHVNSFIVTVKYWAGLMLGQNILLKDF